MHKRSRVGLKGGGGAFPPGEEEEEEVKDELAGGGHSRVDRSAGEKLSFGWPGVEEVRKNKTKTRRIGKKTTKN